MNTEGQQVSSINAIISMQKLQQGHVKMIYSKGVLYAGQEKRKASETK